MANTTIQFVGTATEAQRLLNSSLTFKAMQKAISGGLRVALPGIIKDFNIDRQTVEVQCAIYEKIKPGLPSTLQNYNPVTGDIKIPMLLDCPICIPKAGGFALTLPVSVGDECLVVFADFCINEWFDAGGENNTQQKIRRHSFSDGFALLAPSSIPKALANYQSDAIEMRDGTRTKWIQINSSSIVITSDADIDLNGHVNITGSLNIPGTIQPLIGSGNGTVVINVNGVPTKFVVQS